MLHAETVLLVNDDEPELFKHYILLHDAVRADNDVDFAFGKALNDLLLVAGRAEAA